MRTKVDYDNLVTVLENFVEGLMTASVAPFRFNVKNILINHLGKTGYNVMNVRAISWITS